MSLLLYVIPYLLGISTCLVSGKQTELDHDGWLEIRLWQAFNDDPRAEFTERGNITVSSVRSGTFVLGQNGLQKNQIQQLESLARSTGRYRLKVVSRSWSGLETTYLTSVPACQIIGSEFEDVLTIWLDGTGEPVSIGLSSPGPCGLENPFTSMWTTNVVIKYPETGPVPDTATYIQKLDKEREARERGDAKDNRSFFAKYWMYIVPTLIFIVLTSATNPEAAAAAGGTSQRQ